MNRGGGRRERARESYRRVSSTAAVTRALRAAALPGRVRILTRPGRRDRGGGGRAWGCRARKGVIIGVGVA